MSHPPLTDDQRAMVANNLGLVVYVIDRWYPTCRGNDDAFQDGVEGLMRAVVDYDPARARFSTYAVHWIRHGIGYGLGRADGINARRDRAARRTYEAPMSLDYPVGQGGTLGDIVADRSTTGLDVADLATDQVLAEDLVSALRRLAVDALDRACAARIIARAIGLPAPTMPEIAARHGCVAATVHNRNRALLAGARNHLLGVPA